MSDLHSKRVEVLTAAFRRISEVLYDTSVAPEQLDAEILPYLAPEVRFTDPWQQASGRDKYRLGAAGFHTLLSFKLEILQLNVQLEPGALRGRALVDATMHLTPLGARFPFPLRTILKYDFTLLGEPADGHRFLIDDHEEMWSLADLIAAVPVAGWIYKNLFRKGFSVGFLAASYLSCRARGVLPPSRPPG